MAERMWSAVAAACLVAGTAARAAAAQTPAEADLPVVPQAETAARDSVTGTGVDLLADVGYARREAYLEAASAAIDVWRKRLAPANLPEDLQDDISRFYGVTEERYEALQHASEEAWPAAIDNFRYALGRLRAAWQDLKAESASGAG